jgi:protocatechuate 3,4-dioxygenase beta subunit
MRRVASTLLLLGSIVRVASAQPPPRGIAPQQTGIGSIRGRVLAADSDAPLRNARVQIASAAGAVPAVFTDADGRFVVSSIIAGRYRISAAKPGYLATSFGARRFEDPGIQVAVADRAIDGVELRLPKSAAISGRIIDSRGDPVIGLLVTAEIHSTIDAKAAPVTAATTHTDDRGDYRLGGLPPRNVLVAVNVGPGVVGPTGGSPVIVPGIRMTTVINGRAVTVSTDSILTRTYYPGGTNPAEAQAIMLSAGDEKTAIDFVVPSSLPRMFFGVAGDLPAAGAAKIGSTGAIRGRITRADGRPLPGAIVRLSEIFPPPTAVTDDEGHYELLRLPAGNYQVIASRAGFITSEYGQRRSLEPGESVELGPGDSRERIDISLPDPAAIAGRIVDDGGEAVEGADVRVLQIRYEAGRRRLVDVSGAGRSRSDDLGRYRIYGLPPGEYVVRALVGQIVAFPESTLDLPGYAPTYFPGTWNPSEAGLVDVGVAQQFSGVDFALARAPMARISGKAVDAAGNPVTGGLGLSSSGRSGSVAGIAVGARINGDGTFEFPNVPPGEYVLQGWKSHGNPWTEGEFASQFVSVNGADVTGISIHLLPGSAISGRITLEGGPPIKLAEIELSPIPADADLSPLTGNPPARAEIKADWTFEMAGVSGPRRLALMRAPPGWTLKSVLMDGIDVTDTPMPFGAKDQSIRGLEVVLTGRGGEVFGRLSDSRGRSLTDYTAVVFATDRERWFPASRFLKQARPGTDGVFTVRGLPDGEYFVAAVDRLRPDEWQDPDFLESILSGATRVALREGQTLSVSPKLIAR